MRIVGPKKKAEHAPPPSFALAMLIVDLVGAVRVFRSLMSFQEGLLQDKFAKCAMF